MPSVHRAAAHQRTLAMLFEHPLSHNIEWKDVLHFLESIGTTAEGGHGSLHVAVNGKTAVLHGTKRKTLDDTQVMQLRHFLRNAGIEPAP